MMIIDAHHHLGPEPDYMDRLYEACQRLSIRYVCLLGLPDWIWAGCTSNDRIEKAFNKYSDCFIGFAFIQLGKDEPEKVREYYERGFKGLKLDFPHAGYDDPSYFPIYEQAAILGMPLYFHTGITGRFAGMEKRYISSNFMRPICLDAVAGYFPELNILMAHTGNPWLDEAAMLLRIHPNLYSDLTGSTLKYRTPQALRSVLWWGGDHPYGDPLKRHAFEKIVFGSDVHWDSYEDIQKDYQNLMEELDLPDEIRAKIWGATFAKLLGLV